MTGRSGFPTPWRCCRCRQDALSSAGEAREEMRLDEAFCDEQLRFGGQRIDHQRRTGGQDTDLRAALRTKRVVDDDLFRRTISGPSLCSRLLHVGLPVAAGCDQKRDIDVRVSLPELLQHQRKDIAAGDRPRMIADDDDGIAFSLCQLAQARTGDRLPHGLGDQLPAAACRFSSRSREAITRSGGASIVIAVFP